MSNDDQPTIEQIWNFYKTTNTLNTAKKYQVPRVYHDSLQISLKSQLNEIANFRVKRPKGLFFIPQKHSSKNKNIQDGPYPWSYDVRPQWIKDQRYKQISVDSKEQQNQRQIWLGIPKDRRTFQNPSKSKDRRKVFYS